MKAPATKNLGERCIEWLRQAMRDGASAAPYGQPNTSDFVRMVLAPCVRDVDGNGDTEPLGLTVGNWCAAVQCYALRECLQDGEETPHLYRAGVVELVADAEDLGRWYPLDSGHVPEVGDLAIWDRSEPGKPETGWWRHVNRVTFADPNGFKTIGGNEGRAIRVAHHRWDAPKLLGFISYAQAGDEDITRNPEAPPDVMADMRGKVRAFQDWISREAVASVQRDAKLEP